MISNIPDLLKHLYKNIKLEMDVAVIGMSGGADSTLCSILCANALKSENVYSCHMPMTSKDEEYYNKNSLEIANYLGLQCLKFPIQEIVNPLNNLLSSEFPLDSISTLNKGNSRSRIRMSLMYGVSHHVSETLNKKTRVVGTGNLSEDYIGYDTKGGDALADYFIIGDLFKSEVYQLLDYFKAKGQIRDSMIDRVPSAALWEGQTDEQELGYSYDEMELSIRKIMHSKSTLTSEIDLFVKNRHLANKHKHEAPKVLSLRNYCC